MTAWATRKRTATSSEAGEPDPEDRPARLRERITALETTSKAHGEQLEHHGDEIALLRAQEVTLEGIARDRQRRRRPST